LQRFHELGGDPADVWFADVRFVPHEPCVLDGALDALAVDEVAVVDEAVSEEDAVENQTGEDKAEREAD